jgi:hypothetical protein
LIEGLILEYLEEIEMNKNKLYVVTYGAATYGEGPVDIEGIRLDANCGCVGIFLNKEDAQKEMTKFKDSLLDEITKNHKDSYDDESYSLALTQKTQVYGSESEEYYEIDYVIDFTYNYAQYFIRIEEKHC